MPSSPSPEQLANLRQEYSLQGMHRADLDPDPIRQFGRWLSDALAHGILEPNAMTLATVDATGQPWTRTVLLKVCDERGFTFFTNYDGSKGRQLAERPVAALTFWWPILQRQVNVTGVVTQTSRTESAHYFATRPMNSRLGAWASAQSATLADRGELERRFEEVRARFGDKEVPLPPQWGGYCVEPRTIEFWQGRQSRLHDRLRYTRQDGGGWTIDRLAP